DLILRAEGLECGVHGTLTIANLAKHELLKVWQICLRDCPVSLKQIKLYYLGSLHIFRNSK
ncbi:hypothetical protein A152_0022685, partial [Vibrio tasmaniensis 1F-187]